MTRIWLGIVLSAVALGLASCGQLFPSAELHYKLAVDVDVDGVIYHGEGVYRVNFQSQGPLLIGNEPQWTVGVVGEAFPVDLGERGMMFALMYADWFRRPASERAGHRYGEFTSPTAGRQALWSYFNFAVNDFPTGRESQAKIEAFAKSKAIVDMPATALPLLVRFRDINDPKTIERVDPDSIATSFGSGVKITRVTASIVDEKTTTGLERYLKWLPALRGSIGWGMNLPYTNLLNVCDEGAFKQGKPEMTSAD